MSATVLDDYALVTTMSPQDFKRSLIFLLASGIWRNPCMPLAELLGSMAPWLKNTVICQE